MYTDGFLWSWVFLGFFFSKNSLYAIRTVTWQTNTVYKVTQIVFDLINKQTLNKIPSPPSQFLPVPELMPFRLTQQLVNLMQPLRESGLIQSVMVHSLRAYRAEPDLLLNTMDVFVKEPLLDWKVNSEIQPFSFLQKL